MSKVEKKKFGASLSPDEGQANYGIALLNQRGICTYADAAFVALSGIAQDTLYSTPLQELLPLPGLDHLVALESHSDLLQEQAEQKLATLSYNLALHRENRPPLPVILNINRTLCGKDQPLLLLTLRAVGSPERDYVSTSIDETTYHLAAEAAGIGVWEQDFSTNSVTVSAVAAHIIGLPAQETFLTEDQWQQMVWPEDLPLLLKKKRKGDPERRTLQLGIQANPCRWAAHLDRFPRCAPL